LTLAIREVIACFPVYRTYISPEDTRLSERDQKYILIAIEKAKSKTPALNPAVYDFLRDVLLLKLEAQLIPEERKFYKDFVLRFQQLTSPIMAKGLEDTSFYIYNRFISLNEVGGDPTHFGYSREDFHRQNRERNKRWPASFIASSTHDTKRSQDVRMRLDVLSEFPEDWKANIARWTILNEKHKTLIKDILQPRRNMEYFIYQALVGVWPNETLTEEAYSTFSERLWQYFQKSVREAKIFTSWLNPNPEYEEAVKKFVFGILSSPNESPFLASFLPFQRKIANFGMFNSLSALVLKLGSPGVIDTYQGTEIWDYSLVDPDNRRPVNYEHRKTLLNSLKKKLKPKKPREEFMKELLQTKSDGRIKLFLLWQGLNFIKLSRGLFIGGDYIPLEVKGVKEKNVIALGRKNGNQIAIVAVARFFSELISSGDQFPTSEETWAETYIVLPNDFANQPLKDVFTGNEIHPDLTNGIPRLRASEIFKHLSTSLLTNVVEMTQ
jgi:(1->4)-alpha-D-glucan 1-alpha-D-glucosylmutase